MAGLKPSLAATPIAIGSWYLIAQFAAPENVAALGIAISTALVGGHFALGIKKSPKPKRPPPRNK
jgi:hypothetical protein